MLASIRIDHVIGIESLPYRASTDRVGRQVTVVGPLDGPLDGPLVGPLDRGLRECWQLISIEEADLISTQLRV